MYKVRSNEMIWKATLPAKSGLHWISVPSDAEFLSAHAQHDGICVWFRFDENVEKGKVDKPLVVSQTGQSGHDIKNRFLGTCLFDQGGFVLHVFEVTQ
jgi:hypothetical protein